MCEYKKHCILCGVFHKYLKVCNEKVELAISFLLQLYEFLYAYIIPKINAIFHILYFIHICIKLSHHACQKSIASRFNALGERTMSACRAQIIAAITQGGNGNYSMCTQRITNFEQKSRCE